MQARTCCSHLRMPAHAPTLKRRYTHGPAPLAQRQVCSRSDMCLLARLSLSAACAAGCQLHPAHVITVIHLQAFFLWHHSKDCIQVQHNFTRYKKGELPSPSLKKLSLSVYDLLYSSYNCLHLILRRLSMLCITQEPSSDLTRPHPPPSLSILPTSFWFSLVPCTAAKLVASS